MKKGKTLFISLFFSAVVTAVLFYIFSHKFFLFFWNFDLLAERHWMHIWNKWESGWVIRKPKEVLFFIAVLLLIPSYLLSWFCVHKFPWKKFFRLPLTYLENKKKERLQAQSLAAALGPSEPQHTTAVKKEPEKVIKISAQKLSQIDHLRGKKTVSHRIAAQTSPTVETAPGSTQNTSKKLSKEDEAVARFELWESLAKSLETEKIFILRQMKIKNHPVNTFAVTQDGIFLLCEGPALGNTWEVHDNAEPPIWQTEKEAIPSPLRPLVESKEILQQYFSKKMPQYANVSINCCMILDHGNVTNTEALLKYLEEWDISVLRMGTCQTHSLPDTHALIEYIKSQPVSTQTFNDAVAVAILDLMESENGQ